MSKIRKASPCFDDVQLLETLWEEPAPQGGWTSFLCTDLAVLWHELQFPITIPKIFTTAVANITSVFVQETKAQKDKLNDGYKHFQLFFVYFINFYCN